MKGENVLIRDEHEEDWDAITAVTVAAFRGRAYSGGTEQFIVLALRRAGVMVISLVAEVEGRVVGHVAFSGVGIGDGSAGWYGLGPVAVLPEVQRRGIGTRLIGEGLRRLREMGASGCVVVGDAAYYGRFGFRHCTEMWYAGAPAEDFKAVAFGEGMARGEVRFHEGVEAVG